MSDFDTENEGEKIESVELTPEELSLKAALLSKAQFYREGQERALEEDIEELIRMHIK